VRIFGARRAGSSYEFTQHTWMLAAAGWAIRARALREVADWLEPFDATCRRPRYLCAGPATGIAQRILAVVDASSADQPRNWEAHRRGDRPVLYCRHLLLPADHRSRTPLRASLALRGQHCPFARCRARDRQIYVTCSRPRRAGTDVSSPNTVLHAAADRFASAEWSRPASQGGCRENGHSAGCATSRSIEARTRHFGSMLAHRS